MKSVRERFEEIWPVPVVIYFADGEYYPYDGAHATDEIVAKCEELDARLDTFTRCQETMATVNEIIFHATNLLNYVRDKYGVAGDDFSCEHMRGIAEAIKEIKK